jgi:hypothetical protein
LYSETSELPNPRERKSRSIKPRQAIGACRERIMRACCIAASAPAEHFNRLLESGMAWAFLAHPPIGSRAVRRCARTQSPRAARGFSCTHQCC